MYLNCLKVRFTYTYINKIKLQKLMVVMEGGGGGGGGDLKL